MRVDSKLVIIILAPLALSSVTHLWNATGFPDFSHDDGIYIQRAMVVLEGEGPQEKQFYDHPYFGQLFFASVFRMIDYPDSINVQPGDIDSVKALYLVPRLLMGILAVADTFLIYKIAERKYNRKVAFVAAILFAVMPYSTFVRRIYLDTIQLPLILSSILFALYARTTTQQSQKFHYETKTHILTWISGIFLGLAIFAKLPAFTMIPLLGYLIYMNNNKSKRSLKQLGVWFIPVILIPAIWPAYALSLGQFDNWLDGVLYHTQRDSKPLIDTLKVSLYKFDALLLFVGIAGIVYTVAIRKELFLLLWTIPPFAFLYLIDYVSSFHFITILPAFCIGAAILALDGTDKVLQRITPVKLKLVKTAVPAAIIAAIGFYGMMNTMDLILQSKNSSLFQTIAIVAESLSRGQSHLNEGEGYIGDYSGSTEYDKAAVPEGDDSDLTVIGGTRYFWIPQYVFDQKEPSYKTQYNLIGKKSLEDILDGSERVLMISDRDLMKVISEYTDNVQKKPPKDILKAQRFKEIYDNTATIIKIDQTEIRTNY